MDPVVHFEMPAEDKKRMAEFYSKAFGWHTQQLGPEMGEYVVVTTTEVDEQTGRLKAVGSINGGFYSKTSDPMSHHPSIVIAIEDVQESIKKVEAAGGKILGKPQEIPGIGWYASILDTEGNRVSLLQPSAPMEVRPGSK